MGALRRPAGGGSVGAAFSGGERNRLFRNRKAEQFDNLSGISGLDNPNDGRGFVTWDYDRDGWIDLALVNANQPLTQVYRNEIGIGGNGAHVPAPMVAVRLRGGNQGAQASSETSNRDGYGALVTVHLPGDRRVLRELRCGEGMASQNSSTLLIGVGDAPRVEGVTVRWPSGKITRIERKIALGSEIEAFENPAHGPKGEAFAISDYTRKAKQPGGDRTPTKPRRLQDVGLVLPESESELRLFITMATWCAACTKEGPQVEALRQGFKPTELELFGVPIDPDDDAARLKAYVKRHRPQYELLLGLDPERVREIKEFLLTELKSDALPATILVDRSGRILSVRGGLPSISEVRRVLGNRSD